MRHSAVDRLLLQVLKVRDEWNTFVGPADGSKEGTDDITALAWAIQDMLKAALPVIKQRNKARQEGRRP